MRIRSFLSPKAMLSLTHSLLLGRVRYCITNRCFGNESKVREIQRICDKFIRLVFNLKRHDSVKMIMKQSGLLNIKQIYQVELAIFMCKTVKKSHPIALQNLFQSKPSRISTRSNSLYIYPAYRLTVCQRWARYFCKVPVLGTLLKVPAGTLYLKLKVPRYFLKKVPKSTALYFFEC